jgi:tripartite-type tricarboxylate transporter receptor subunit TctC
MGGEMVSGRRLCAFACLCAIALAGVAIAQGYPAKPVRLIVPFPPGGATDVLSRAVGQKLAESFKQQFVIDNRSGASGILGLELAGRAVPDGYTIAMAQATNLAINLAVMGKLPYDPVRDFAPISLVATSHSMLVVHPSLPVRSIKDLVALAKARPGAINYASAGGGGPGHILTERFKKAAKIDMVHVPYKGANPALNDVVAGHVQLYFTSPISAQPFLQSGRLRGIATAGVKRSPSMPELPTIAESGYPEIESTSWWGLVAPVAVPRDIIDRLGAETARILNTPEVKERLVSQGAEPVGNTPDQFAAFIKSEITKWARMVKETGVKVH